MDAAIRRETKKGDESFENINQLQRSLEEEDSQIESLSDHSPLLEGKRNYLLHYRFGSKSDNFDGRQQLLFENKNASCEVETTTEIEVPANTRKIGGRCSLPKDFPRIRVEHDLPEDDKQSTCSHCLTRRGEDTSFQYDVIPAKFQVVESIKLKYGCLNPMCDHPQQTARQDPPPPLPQTQASPDVLAWIGTSKLVDGLPLNRIAGIAEKRFGVPCTSTTLADWMIKGAERIVSSLVAAMEKSSDERRRYRQEIVKPHLDKNRSWINENQVGALNYGGLLASTFNYIHNQ